MPPEFLEVADVYDITQRSNTVVNAVEAMYLI